VPALRSSASSRSGRHRAAEAGRQPVVGLRHPPELALAGQPEPGAEVEVADAQQGAVEGHERPGEPLAEQHHHRLDRDQQGHRHHDQHVDQDALELAPGEVRHEVEVQAAAAGERHLDLGAAGGAPAE
jgi:hypothetical protein